MMDLDWMDWVDWEKKEEKSFFQADFLDLGPSDPVFFPPRHNIEDVDE